MKLATALMLIEQYWGKEVVMIEFEDGSGFKFNYKLEGESKAKFRDFKSDTW